MKLTPTTILSHKKPLKLLKLTALKPKLTALRRKLTVLSLAIKLTPSTTVLKLMPSTTVLTHKKKKLFNLTKLTVLSHNSLKPTMTRLQLTIWSQMRMTWT